MAPLNSPLDVLRVMVAAVDDDQILEPARDEQLAVGEEALISGAEIGPVGRVRRSRHKSPSLSPPAGPSSRGPRWAPRPRPHPPGRGDMGQGLGVDDGHLLIEQGVPAGDKGLGPVLIRPRPTTRPSRSGFDLDLKTRGREGLRPGNHQGRLGQPVTRVEGIGPKAARREGRREPLQGVPADRFGTAERQLPAAQVAATRILSGEIRSTQMS